MGVFAQPIKLILTYMVVLVSVVVQSRMVFVWFDSLRPSQQFYSYVGKGLPVLNRY